MATFIPNRSSLALSSIVRESPSDRFGPDVIIVCGNPAPHTFDILDKLPFRLRFFETPEATIKAFMQHGLSSDVLPAAFLVEGEDEDVDFWQPFLDFRHKDPRCKLVPLIFLGQDLRQTKLQQAQQWLAQDIFNLPLSPNRFEARMVGIIQTHQARVEEDQSILEEEHYQIPTVKRVFDIVVSGTILLLLSPLMLLVALLVKLESPGPIFYISKRVGTGYQIFNFLKFRSMRQNADKELSKIKTLNQYVELSKDEEPIFTKLHDSVDKHLEEDPGMMMTDEGVLSEGEAIKYKRAKNKGTFVKVKDDPRITRVGKIIRNTSIDELPQLINVLKGDMSLVGNRPLPLYEAEKLTTDAWSLRFMAPAGITGLWQVVERGKASNSEEKRKSLDVDYANQYSIWLDIKILFMTIPALLQQENV